MTANMKKTKILIDTDPGDDIDDAFALLLAAKSPELDVVGVTTVFRNTAARARMTRCLLRSADRGDISIRAGIDTPFIQTIKDVMPPELLVKETLDRSGKYRLPQYDDSMDAEPVDRENAVDFIIRMAHEHAGELTLVLIGPFTNAAMAVRKDPTIVSCIKEVRVIGGYYWKDIAEWNVACDPEAAHIVFTADWPVYAVGIDVTMQCALNTEDVVEFRSLQGEAQSLVADMMKKWFSYYQFNAPVMHDPLVIGTILCSEFVSFSDENVRVGLAGNERGKTILEPEATDRTARLFVSRSVDAAAFLKLFKERVFGKKERMAV